MMEWRRGRLRERGQEGDVGHTEREGRTGRRKDGGENGEWERIGRGNIGGTKVSPLSKSLLISTLLIIYCTLNLHKNPV